MNTTINITERQFDPAERAVIRAVERFQRRVSDGDLDELPELPTLEGVILNLPANEEVIEIILANLEGEAGRKRGEECDQRPALLLARKIRKVTGFRGLA